MNSFTSTREWQGVREQKFASMTRRVSFDDAAGIKGFERALEVHALWSDLNHGIPNVKSLRPALIPSGALSSMIVLDVIDNGKDFRWRLFGSEHTFQFGVDATGMLMSKAAKLDTSAHQHLPIIKECYATRRPILFVTDYCHATSSKKATYNVALPLTDDEGNITRIFGCSSWY